MSNQEKRFLELFQEGTVKLQVVTGAFGVGGGKAGKEALWTASINIIAWKNLSTGEVKEEKLRLEWLADDQELEIWREKIQEESIINILGRFGENRIMMVELLEESGESIHKEMINILEEYRKPIFYNDEYFGALDFQRGMDSFEKEIIWNGEKGRLSILCGGVEDIDKYLDTAKELFKNEKCWNEKIREYAADELLELANEWLEDDDEAEYDVITREMFKEKMELEGICIYEEGEFEIFFYDGDMFWGHCIIVSGDIKNGITSAQMAG